MPFGDADDSVNTLAAAMQGDGRIVLVATANKVDANGVVFPRMKIARLTAEGHPDQRFAPGGIAERWVERGSEAWSVAIRPDGRIVVGGMVWTGVEAGSPVQKAAVFQLAGGDSATVDSVRHRTAVEYFNAGYGHYFVSTDPDEIMSLDAARPSDWVRTGRTFEVWAEPAAGLLPVCRFWSGQTFAPKSSHFFTPYASECASLRSSSAWQFEREAFFLRLPSGASDGGTCADGSRPLYRAYNNGVSGAPNHRYTIDEAVLDAMIAQGWSFEGEVQTRVFACVPAQ